MTPFEVPSKSGVLTCPSPLHACTFGRRALGPPDGPCPSEPDRELDHYPRLNPCLSGVRQPVFSRLVLCILTQLLMSELERARKLIKDLTVRWEQQSLLIVRLLFDRWGPVQIRGAAGVSNC